MQPAFHLPASRKNAMMIFLSFHSESDRVGADPARHRGDAGRQHAPRPGRAGQGRVQAAGQQPQEPRDDEPQWHR